jgi:hypothetical protein
MKEFQNGDLPPLNIYRANRDATMARAMKMRSVRRLAIGEHVVLLFENRATIYFQIMEMLHIEQKDSLAAREEELLAYNPLISDKNNLKATMQIEYEDKQERDIRLTQLKEIERHMWWRIGDADPIYAIADEDMPRSNDDKTSAVHFLRYPLSDAARADAAKLPWVFGCDHPQYQQQTGISSEDMRAALMEDLELSA